MPKAILSFKLPEENEEYKDARLGTSYSIIINEFDTYLRNKMKYEELSPEEYQIYQNIRGKLGELRYEHTSD